MALGLRLSAQERAVIQSNYEDMPQADSDRRRTCWYPRHLCYRCDGERAWRRHQGDLVQYPSVDAARIVAYVLVKTKYKPAVCHGVPCIMDFPFSIKLVTAP
jgi:hypothetical protein